MANSIHEAVWDWLQGCPHIADLFFNYSQTDNGDTRLIPSETVKQEFMDGSCEMNYNVALTRYLPVSDNPNDRTNVDITVDFEKIAEWIEEQMQNCSLPDAPNGIVINYIEVMPNESGYMVAQDANIGEYMLQFRIEYLKSKR